MTKVLTRESIMARKDSMPPQQFNLLKNELKKHEMTLMPYGPTCLVNGTAGMSPSLHDVCYNASNKLFPMELFINARGVYPATDAEWKTACMSAIRKAIAVDEKRLAPILARWKTDPEFVKGLVRLVRR